MKKKLALLCTIFFLSIGGHGYAYGKVDFGLNIGALSPEDSKVKETLGSNFLYKAYVGLLDDSGLQARGSISTFTGTSHNPIDIGENFRFTLTSLQADVIFNVNSGGFLQPYMGVGAGASFYDVNNDRDGKLESGTKFGAHFLGGVKVNFAQGGYISLEYEKKLLPKIYFNRANDFNTSSLTIGVGMALPIYLDSRSYSKNVPSIPEPVTYRYTKAEESQLARIEQIKTEITEMTNKKAELESQVDNFYKKASYNEQDPEFLKEYKRIAFIENKLKSIDKQIDKASKKQEELEEKWRDDHPQTPRVEEHIVYLRTNYVHSPWGLSRRNGYFVYDTSPYRYQYYSPVIIDRGPTVIIKGDTPPPTPEERNLFFEKKKERINESKNR